MHEIEAVTLQANTLGVNRVPTSGFFRLRSALRVCMYRQGKLCNLWRGTSGCRCRCLSGAFSLLRLCQLCGQFEPKQGCSFHVGVLPPMVSRSFLFRRFRQRIAQDLLRVGPASSPESCSLWKNHPEICFRVLEKLSRNFSRETLGKLDSRPLENSPET